MGEPAGEVRIAALGRKSAHETRPVKSVALLGSNAALKWTQQDDALVIALPASLPTGISSSFKIGF